MGIQVTVMSLDLDAFEQPITKVFEKDEITLGRGDGNDIVLARPDVSTKHAKLKLKKGDNNSDSLIIMDLGSANGTMVESTPLKADVEVAVLPNQRIIIGSYLIKPRVAAGLKGGAKQATPVSAPEPTASTNGDVRAKKSTMMGNAEELRNGGGFEKPQVSVSNINGNGELKETMNEPVISTITEKEELKVTKPTDLPKLDTHKHEAPKHDALKVDHPKGGSPLTVEPAFVPQPSTTPSGIFKVKVAAGIGSEDLVLDFEASMVFSVGGEVLHNGKPLEGVEINGGGLGFTRTDSSGKFEFLNIPEDTKYSLSVRKDKFKFDNDLQEGVVTYDVKKHVFNAKELLTLKGKVIHKGVALSGVIIDGGAIGKTTTSDDGSYVFYNVPEGEEYTLTAIKDGFVFGQIKR